MQRAGSGRQVRALCLCMLLVGGCSSSLINPHIEIGESPTGEVSFTTAEEYAKGAQRNYREALGEHAEFNSLLGATLIPLGAATLGLGITGASTTAVTVLGLTGATGFGVGAWLRSTPTQQAFIAGYNATGCAVEAMLPLKLNGSASNAQYVEFRSNLDSINASIEAVQTSMAKVRRSLIAATDANLKALADEDLQVSKALVDNAAAAQSNGVSLTQEIDRAGDNLVSAVDRIAGQVDQAILDNRPDLAALVGIIGGLGKSYAQFTTVPQGLSSAGDMAAAEGKPEGGAAAQAAPLQLDDLLREALVELQQATVKLGTNTRVVANFINAMVAKKPLEALAACGVDPQTIVAAITIDPAGPLRFAQGKAGSQGFVITGGREPYRAGVAGGEVAGLSVVQPSLFGRSFVVNATKDVAEGEYSVFAADSAGREEILKVVVGKPASGGGSTPEDITKEIQRRLCVNPDGDFGQNSQSALRLFQAAEGLTVTGTRSAAVDQQILAMTEDERTVQCERVKNAGTPPATPPGNADLATVVSLIKTLSFGVNAETFTVKDAALNSTGDKVVVTWDTPDGVTLKETAVAENDLKIHLVDEFNRMHADNKITAAQVDFANYKLKQ